MNTIEIPLNLPKVAILSLETNQKGDFIITIESTQEGTCCHKCGRKTTHCLGHDRPIELRHLSILGKKTYIRICPARYHCSSCNGTTTQRLCWYVPRSPHTKAYDEYLLLSLVNSTVSDVSIKEDVGYEAVMGVINRHVATEVDWDEINRLDLVGIDEVALKKGHRSYVTIISYRLEAQTRVLAVLSDRKKETVKEFLLSIPKRLRKTIRAVCSDMYEGFLGAVKEVFGKRVLIVVDRFHVAKLYRKEVDSLRKREMKRLKKALSEQEYKALKGVMWALRKTDPNEQDQVLLDRLFWHSPLLKLAYELSCDLSDIFNKDQSRADGRGSVRSWMVKVKQSDVGCFDRFLGTLEKWFDEITNYFVDRVTSGFVEGLNTKVKVLKRRSYGLLNVAHLFQRLQLDLQGYELYALY
ncbi:MAG: ISL3 family transposase [Bacteroidetes bacterium]|nr:ISL3 family transposase [Bacteroidota bacterium]